MHDAGKPAYPAQASNLAGSLEPTPGLTKRELIAAMAMQGLLCGNAMSGRRIVNGSTPELGDAQLARRCVEIANALLAEFAEPHAEGLT